MRFLLLCCLLGNAFFTYGQEDWAKVQDRDLVDLRRSLEERPAIEKHYPVILPAPVGRQLTRERHTPRDLPNGPVPPAWQYEELAFFCKLEVKMEKALRLPVKFRLGEVQAVEQKEGKLKTHFIRQ